MLHKTISLLAGAAFHSPDLQAARTRLPAAEYYAAPYGSPDGDGSYTNPWDLATVLAQPEVLLPGDTIWLRGGH